MEAFYWEPPKPEELKMWGFSREECPRPEVSVWPENEAPMNLFLSVSTQWRMGSGGAVGLDYNVVYREMDDLGLAGEDRDLMKGAIRTIEVAALRAMRKRG